MNFSITGPLVSFDEFPDMLEILCAAHSPADGDAAPGFELDELIGATGTMDLGFRSPPDDPFLDDDTAAMDIAYNLLPDSVPPSPSLTWSSDSDRSPSPLIEPSSPTMEPPFGDLPYALPQLTDVTIPSFQFGDLNMGMDNFHFDFMNGIADPFSIPPLDDGCGQPPFQHPAGAETAGTQGSAPDVVGNASDFAFPTTAPTPPSPPQQVDLPPSPCAVAPKEPKCTKRKIEDEDDYDDDGQKQPRRRRQDTTPRYPCKICGQLFARTHNVRVHERSHTGEKPFSCKECDKAFSRNHDLTRHWQSAHTTLGSPRRKPGESSKPKAKRGKRNANVNIKKE